MRLAPQVEEFEFQVVNSDKVATEIAQAVIDGDKEALVRIVQGTGVFDDDVDIMVIAMDPDPRLSLRFCLLHHHCCVDV
jgi:hypothetical protein